MKKFVMIMSLIAASCFGMQQEQDFFDRLIEKHGKNFTKDQCEKFLNLVTTLKEQFDLPNDSQVTKEWRSVIRLEVQWLDAKKVPDEAWLEKKNSKPYLFAREEHANGSDTCQYWLSHNLILSIGAWLNEHSSIPLSSDQMKNLLIEAGKDIPEDANDAIKAFLNHLKDRILCMECASKNPLEDIDLTAKGSIVPTEGTNSNNDRVTHGKALCFEFPEVKLSTSCEKMDPDLFTIGKSSSTLAAWVFLDEESCAYLRNKIGVAITLKTIKDKEK